MKGFVRGKTTESWEKNGMTCVRSNVGDFLHRLDICVPLIWRNKPRWGWVRGDQRHVPPAHRSRALLRELPTPVTQLRWRLRTTFLIWATWFDRHDGSTAQLWCWGCYVACRVNSVFSFSFDLSGIISPFCGSLQNAMMMLNCLEYILFGVCNVSIQLISKWFFLHSSKVLWSIF